MQASNYTKQFQKAILTIAFVFSLGAVDPGWGQNLKQEYTYKHYTVQDGLAQMQVMSMFIDSKGYLWCSTKAGLSRFDGRRFKNFPNAILPGFDLIILGESSSGNLLLFGPSNFAELHDDSLIEYNYPEGYHSSSILLNSKIHKQKVIFTYSAEFESRYAVMDYSNPEALKIYDVDQKLGKIIYFEEGKDNLIWQTQNDKIYVSDLKTGTLIRSFSNPKEVKNIVQLGNDFVGTNDKNEVYLIQDSVASLLCTIPEPGRYMKIISSPDGQSLIIKTDQNLYYYKEELIAIKQNLTQIRDLVFDLEENLWVSSEEGLYNFFQLNFVNYTFQMGNKDWVWSVLEDDKNAFWFASYQNGLWKWDGKTTFDYTKLLNEQLYKHLAQRPLPGYYRYYMGASRSGSTLYFPTECNVLKFENNTFTSVQGLPEQPFQMTKVYTDGTLYCSGYPGLFEISGSRLIQSWSREELGVSSILNFERNKNGNILAIGQNGASIILDDSIKHFNDTNLLYSYSLAKDHRDNIWIAGIRNINLFAGDSVKHIASRDEEAFYSMLFVEPHYLFLGGIKGLYIADLEKYYDSGIFETILFNQSNGFTGIECGQNGFLTDSEGMVWIPTSDLVTRFDPQKIISKEINPPRIYLQVSSSEDNISWKTETDGLKNKLSHFQNNLQFTVDAVSFANSGSIRYYYRLEGLLNEWSEPTESNEITYYNLSPGEYVFEVKADAGVSHAESEILRTVFVIEAPFWMKWWFVVFDIVALLFLMYVLIQYFRNREKKKAAIQQRLTQLRSEALSAQLDPHFVMNCLNNISGLINAGYKKQANEYIVKFSKLLRVILQNVKKESIPLSAEIETVTHYMQLEQFRCNECFSFTISLPGNYSTEKIMVPPMMLQPLVENSIKHGFGGTKMEDAHIRIELQVVDKFLNIVISDNGKGLKSDSESLGAGLGTKITRERIELLQKRRNIQFEIQDKNPGAEVRFRIPLVIKPDEF